jgi:hypothetical protein
MRSARRRAQIEKRRKTRLFSGLFLKFVIPLIVLLGIFVFFKVSTKYWNGQDKFTIAYRFQNGDAAVSVLDPKLGELTTLIIPGDTEVEVARNYGELRIKNVWKLGENEKLGGSLLAATISQNFLFPVFLWSDSQAEALSGGGSAGIIKYIFLSKSSNISFGDRLLTGLFALKVGSMGKNTIDLGKSQFLEKKNLNDGQPGYVLSGNISQRLTVYFTDSSFTGNESSGKSLRVAIVDATGSPDAAIKIGSIIEVLGGKIVSIEKKNPADGYCLVAGVNPKAVKKIVDLFSCREGGEKGGFDMEIYLGRSFDEKF